MKTKNPQPFFSIIIPVYNEEKLLKKCLRSVFKQNFPKEKFEVIVVDNNSTDGSIKIASQFPVKIIKEKQQGIVAARNRGLQAAKGKIIVNLDADCTVPKNWLKKIYIQFQHDSNLVLLTGRYLEHKSIVNKFTSSFLYFYEKCFGQSYGYCGGNVAIKKSSLNKIRGYDMRFPGSDQLSLIKKLKKLGKVHFDTNIIVKSSNRRSKNRLPKFFLETCSYFLNILTVKMFGKRILVWENVRD